MIAAHHPGRTPKYSYVQPKHCVFTRPRPEPDVAARSGPSNEISGRGPGPGALRWTNVEVDRLKPVAMNPAAVARVTGIRPVLREPIPRSSENLVVDAELGGVDA